MSFLCQTNLAAGTGTTGTYSNFFQMFNNFNVASESKTPGHGIIQQTANSSYYIGACDTSGGKSFSTSPWTGSFGTPIFVVGAYVLNSGSTDTNVMWVNPAQSSLGGGTPPTNPQADVVAGTNRPPDLAGLVFIDRPGSGTSGGVGTNYIANLLIGTTWSYVTGGPEFTNSPVAFVRNWPVRWIKSASTNSPPRRCSELCGGNSPGLS